MSVQITEDYSDWNDDPLRVPDHERDAAPEAAFRWFRKDDRRLATAQRRGYQRCDSELPDLVLHRTSAANQERWHERVRALNDQQTNPQPREQDGIRSEGTRSRGQPREQPRSDNPTGKKYFT